MHASEAIIEGTSTAEAGHTMDGHGLSINQLGSSAL